MSQSREVVVLKDMEACVMHVLVQVVVDEPSTPMVKCSAGQGYIVQRYFQINSLHNRMHNKSEIEKPVVLKFGAKVKPG